MTQMQALRFERYGDPSILELQTLPIPEPGPGEALVRVEAAAINPSDVKIVSGVFNAALPRTPGRDFAGVVVKGGGWEGRNVWGSGAGFGFARDGAHADYVLVPLAGLAERPAALTPEQAAAVGAPHVAAWSALVDAGRVKAGDVVLVTGALGAVGRAATQIARWKGARVIGADRSAGQSDADLLLDLSTDDLVSAVKAATNGAGVDLALDAVGGPLFEPVMRSLGVGGRQVAITSTVTPRVEFDLTDFYHNKLSLVGVDTAKLSAAEIAAILDALRPGFASGALKPPAVRSRPLADAVDAYRAVAAGDVSAKQILIPGAR